MSSLLLVVVESLKLLGVVCMAGELVKSCHKIDF